VIGPWRELTGQGHSVTAHFCNPNIHPLIEFRRRLKAMKVLQERIPIEVIYEEEYGLREFLEQVDWHDAGGASVERKKRCADCYRLRLGRTARAARERGFEAFTTTLLASTHQDHDVVRSVAEACAQAEGVEFLYRDWRPLADENHRGASALKLYLQQYCGCVFSEQERFQDTGLHLYRGGRP
jgi:hypothetical protein